MKPKKILITGVGSYIGNSFTNWLKQWPEKYAVSSIDMMDGSWRKADFSSFDVVFHVAGLAHADVGRVSEETKALYYKVNTDLTVETAEKAKNEGVKQFIFMSSAIVYGESGGIGKKRVITKDTKPVPANFYGDSKLQAETGIMPLIDERYKICILRPPMIYGKGSKGNYPTLSKFAQKLPVFPNVENERSMLFVDNLCEFVRLLIDNEENGLFFPQNEEYVNTSKMVAAIAKSHGKNVVLTKMFNPILKTIGRYNGLVNKAFGNLVYEKSMSEYPKGNYRVKNLIDSINATEG